MGLKLKLATPLKKKKKKKKKPTHPGWQQTKRK